MADPYVHGKTDEREVARLEKQANFTAALTFERLSIGAGEVVLDLATGVGAMGGLLTRRFANATIIGLDLSASQLGAARRNHPELPVIRADATRLPFADATFDHVHWSWLLEHVPNPIAVLREVRRVLKPRGSCHFIEVDNATFATTPHLPDVARLMRALDQAQLRAHGDGWVGQTLHRAMRIAGFKRFTVTPLHLKGSAKNPAFFDVFLTEFAEIFDGLDESIGAHDPALPSTAAAQLRGLRTLEQAELRYSPVFVWGQR